jgi:hypothetical protein
VYLTSKKYIGVLASLLFATTLLAAHADSVTWNVSKSTMLGSTEVKPGQYEIRAEEGKDQLDVISKGKVVAQVPCHWIQLPSKANASLVEVDDGRVTQIEFGGKTSAVDLKQ